MWIQSSVLALVLFAASLAGAQAQDRVDLSGLDRNMSGPRAQVLVLGSAHLAEHFDDDFDPAVLDPVLDRLEAFAPDVITVESLSGMECDLYRRHPEVFSREGADRFCFDTATARAATGLDVPAAIAGVTAMLDGWPEAPTPSQRRRLASLFLAAGEPGSALVQWLQLPEHERRAGDGLDDVLAGLLRQREMHPSESYQVGARLAARLGLARVFPTDDHTGSNLDIPDDQIEAYGQALQAAWQTASATMDPIIGRSKALAESGDMMGLYRHVNVPEVRQAVAESDFGSALAHQPSQPWGQMYVAAWETRNLRMVANIRAAFASRPGARVLSIVGGSHKPWFDAQFGRMLGVELVEVEQVLGPSPEPAAGR